MNRLSVKIKKLSPDAILPVYGSEDAAGADLCSIEEVTIQPGATALVHTGLAMELPRGYGGFIFARSGLATKRGLAPANKVGVIDADYRGELVVWLLNTSDSALTVSRGDRVAQLVFQPVCRLEPRAVSALSETERGSGGFGHTGRR